MGWPLVGNTRRTIPAICAKSRRLPHSRICPSPKKQLLATFTLKGQGSSEKIRRTSSASSLAPMEQWHFFSIRILMGIRIKATLGRLDDDRHASNPRRTDPLPSGTGTNTNAARRPFDG
jgi:hypothetical protein